MWDLWLEAPDDELWAALSWWRRPRTRGGLSLVSLRMGPDAADVIDAVRRVGHPIADMARDAILAGRQDLVDAACEIAMSTEDESLTRLCVENQLAPADPRRAAVFFLLTGQDEQYNSHAATLRYAETHGYEVATDELQ